MSEVDDVRISRARELEDYQACIALQKSVWNYEWANDVAALPLLLVGNRFGGSLVIAENNGGQVVGFSFALLCRNQRGVPFWWSHITVVAPDLQGMDIGFQLKRFQRDDALENGIREIRWTFDPLEALDAHFNIRKLGAVSRVLEENAYGKPSTELNEGLPTDRLLAEWRLDSTRVTDRLSGDAGLILRDFDGLMRVFETIDGRPGPPDLAIEGSPLLMEMPRYFGALKDGDPKLAARWQGVVRTTCKHYFERGYVATDFVIVDKPRPQAFYVLEKEGG